MTIQEKLHNHFFKISKTCHPRTPGSLFLGGSRLKDMPSHVDEFMRIWLIAYDKKMRRFWFMRPLIEHLFINYRFVTFKEYREIFNDNITKSITTAAGDRGATLLDDLLVRHPIFRLAGVKNERRRQQFTYHFKDDLTGYFALMKKKNPQLYTLFTDWIDVAVPKENRLHTWITGTTGTGKSELMKQMILQDIKRKLSDDCSIIVFDPNGDFVREVAKFKEIVEPGVKEKLMYIDLDLFDGKYTPVINPFYLPKNQRDAKTVDLQLQQIIKVLEEIFDWTGQPLTNQMQVITENIAQLLLDKEDSSFWDLQRIVMPGKSDKEDHKAFPYIQEGKKSMNPATRDFFKEVYDQNKEYQVSKSGIYTKVQKLVRMPAFLNLTTGKSTINMREVFDGNKLLLFNLSIGNLGDVAPIFIGKILVSIIQSVVFRRASEEKSKRKPVYVYIDEFQDFVSPSLLRILTQGRKYQMYLTVANQFVGQGMSREELDGLLGSTKIKIIGYNSNKSLKQLNTETDTELEYLQKLEQGEFMVKIGPGEPFILHPSTSTLDEKNSMTERQWKDIINEQKQKYYEPPAGEKILASMIAEEDGGGSILNRKPTKDNINKGRNKSNSHNSQKVEKPPFNPLHEDDDEPKNNPNREI